MRQSAALLSETPVRLADLQFPRGRVHLHRTRLAYIHLDNLLHFAKIDRDGRIDGYIAAWLPDEVALLFLRGGELISATAFTEHGREVLPIGEALQRMRREVERGEITYCEAPMEQLAWMYESCASPPRRLPVQHADPGALFQGLQHDRFSGVLELISDGRVSYFLFAGGQYQRGYFCNRAEGTAVGAYVEAQFRPHEDGSRAGIVATALPVREAVPEQAAPALIATYRDLFWRITDAAEAEVPDEALRRAERLRDGLQETHAPLHAIGLPREHEAAAFVASPDELTWALADWTHQLLEQLEVIAPGVAPEILKTATREHRFVLQKAGFYGRLPWTVHW